MLGNVPIPKGPILDWIKSEYQGKGHETKQTVIHTFVRDYSRPASEFHAFRGLTHLSGDSIAVKSHARPYQETADLANEILASYAFDIEGPESPGPEHRAQFKGDIETDGRRAVELKKFALQSDAPEPPEADVELMLDAQGSLAANSDETTTDELPNRSLESPGFSSDAIEFDPKETLDDVFNRIDDGLSLMYYAILEQIVNKCVEYAISEAIDYREFDELKVSLKVAMSRF